MRDFSALNAGLLTSKNIAEEWKHLMKDIRLIFVRHRVQRSHRLQCSQVGVTMRITINQFVQ
jgi:hypothetical protein